MTAWRSQNTHYAKNRVPTYYAGNKVYPNSGAPLQVPGRTSRRLHDGLSLTRNYGLDTVSDDVNSSPYSSPYYINGRYNGMEQSTQRGSASSVQGITRLLSVHDIAEDFSDEDVETSLKMWQGKQIKFKMPYNGKIVGNTISIKNTDGCTGLLSIYLSASEDGPVLYETTVDLCKISQDKFEHVTLYGITPVSARANPKREIYIRMEIWDEISMERSANPFNTGRKIEIAATGAGNHKEAIARLGDKNVPAQDKYIYTAKPSRPLIGLIYNDFESVPTNRHEASDFGATVSLNGFKYDLFTIKNATHAEMLVYDRMRNKVIMNSDIKLDGRTERVNLIQAADMVYYVDGYSKLQKFKIGEWASSEVTGTNPPVEAPSYIIFHNNRVYLTGFRYDRNLVQFTEVTEDGPQYESFLYRFYVPDQSPLSTSDNPVTAVVEYSSDTLAFFGPSFISMFVTDSGSGTAETAMPQQVSTFTDGGGVQSDGDVTNFHGVLYSFDQDEGLRRFTGAVWNKIPQSVDSQVERVDMNKPRKLWGYANKLYFNYIDKLDGRYKCMVFDMDMNYQQFPFFQDVDVPVCDVRMDDDYELIASHPDYPCIMRIYDYDTWKRFDTPISFVRYSKYLSIPGNASDMILKRVHFKVLANSNRWWYFALAKDEHSLEPSRKIQAWYRMPTWDTISSTLETENPFAEEDPAGEKSIALLSLMNLKMTAISVQVRVKCKTFRSQASYISTLLECQPKQML